MVAYPTQSGGKENTRRREMATHISKKRTSPVYMYIYSKDNRLLDEL